MALIYNTRRERWDKLSKLEYAEWVDGQTYSMASWRFWDDMYVGISRYLDWNYGPKGSPGNPDDDIAAFKDLLVWKAGEAGVIRLSSGERSGRLHSSRCAIGPGSLPWRTPDARSCLRPHSPSCGG